ncbi:MAG TPA: polysaccharide deacetylase family protein [Chloroflexota bacterium]|nr:polysaccharide deacetylase family protein [Chloroflexota bacterium]
MAYRTRSSGRPWPGPLALVALAGVLAALMFLVARAQRTDPIDSPAPAATTAPPERPASVVPTAAQARTRTPAPAQPTATAVPAKATATPTPVAAIGEAGVVALTFDAGADLGRAEDILDALRDQHVPATFGITGLWARAHPDLVRRMVADGHQVINHTLDHRSFTGLSDERGGLTPAERRQELIDAEAILSPLIGHSPRPWYRLPYGDDDARVSADVAPAGYTNKVGWTVDSLGWRGVAAPDIVARCLRLAEDGAIYVFHVGEPSQDAIALPRIIAGLRDRGYSFATVAGLP